MNPTKTKIMTNSTETPIITDGTPIPYCKEYNYLASQGTGKMNSKEESVSHGANSGASNSYYY
jgi:hypothetical protein